MLPLDAGPCQIRAWRPGDRAALVRNANNRKVWRMLRDQFPHPYTAADADAWIAVADAQNPPTSFAIVADGAEAVSGLCCRRTSTAVPRSWATGSAKRSGT